MRAHMGTEKSSLHRVQRVRTSWDLIKASATDVPSRNEQLERCAMLLLLLLCNSADTFGF